MHTLGLLARYRSLKNTHWETGGRTLLLALLRLGVAYHWRVSLCVLCLFDPRFLIPVQTRRELLRERASGAGDERSGRRDRASWMLFNGAWYSTGRKARGTCARFLVISHSIYIIYSFLGQGQGRVAQKWIPDKAMAICIP